MKVHELVLRCVTIYTCVGNWSVAPRTILPYAHHGLDVETFIQNRAGR